MDSCLLGGLVGHLRLGLLLDDEVRPSPYTPAWRRGLMVTAGQHVSDAIVCMLAAREDPEQYDMAIMQLENLWSLIHRYVSDLEARIENGGNEP